MTLKLCEALTFKKQSSINILVKCTLSKYWTDYASTSERKEKKTTFPLLSRYEPLLLHLKNEPTKQKKTFCKEVLTESGPAPFHFFCVVQLSKVWSIIKQQDSFQRKLELSLCICFVGCQYFCHLFPASFCPGQVLFYCCCKISHFLESMKRIKRRTALKHPQHSPVFIQSRIQKLSTFFFCKH